MPKKAENGLYMDNDRRNDNVDSNRHGAEVRRQLIRQRFVFYIYIYITVML